MKMTQRFDTEQYVKVVHGVFTGHHGVVVDVRDHDNGVQSIGIRQDDPALDYILVPSTQVALSSRPESEVRPDKYRALEPQESAVDRYWSRCHMQFIVLGLGLFLGIPLLGGLAAVVGLHVGFGNFIGFVGTLLTVWAMHRYAEAENKALDT